jgi:hypothetical protein
MSKRKKEIESLSLFPDHVASYSVKGGNGMTDELRRQIKKDEISEKIEEILPECCEAGIEAGMGKPNPDYSDISDQVRAILLTAVNLWRP